MKFWLRRRGRASLPVDQVWGGEAAAAQTGRAQHRRRGCAYGTLPVGACNVDGWPGERGVFEQQADPLEARSDHGGVLDAVPRPRRGLKATESHGLRGMSARWEGCLLCMRMVGGREQRGIGYTASVRGRDDSDRGCGWEVAGADGANRRERWNVGEPGRLRESIG